MRAWLAVFLLACHAPAPLGPGHQRDQVRAEALAVLGAALRSAPPPAQVAAIQAAERLNEATLFDPVTRLLDSDVEIVRVAAAEATVRAHPDAARVLRQSLRSTDPAARALAVAAIGRRVGDLARDDLSAALTDPDPRVREAAVQAVAPFADPGTLARIATGDGSGPVRARAFAALASRRVGPKEARAGLRDPYLGARLAAADALRAAVPGAEADSELRALHDPWLDLHLADRGAAIRAAAAAPDPALREAAANAVTGEADLAQVLARDPQPAVRMAAARALRRAGRAAEAREVFAAGLGLADPGLRLQAAADLAADGDERGAAALAALARDGDPALRVAALRAYPRRGTIPEPWVAALRDDSVLVRVTAAELLLERLS